MSRDFFIAGQSVPVRLEKYFKPAIINVHFLFQKIFLEVFLNEYF